MSLQFSATRQLGRFRYEAALDADQELVVLYGHSGAGKSLTLQFIAGLMRPDSGRIVLGERPVFDSSQRLDLVPQERRVGYVVQSLAVFPHMSVAANVAFGMEGARSEREARVRSLLGLMDLAGFEKRMPQTLSGGQLQRVALARALGRQTDILLLDEPFSALDESLRETMRRELLRLRNELGLTILFVTHDLREAHLLADRIAVFDQGRVLQFDQRDTLFRRPGSRRVAELTGVRNVFPGTILGRDGSDCLTVGIGEAHLRTGSWAPAVDDLPPGSAVDIAIRPERVVLRRGTPDEIDGGNLIAASIVDDLAYGASHTLRMTAAGAPLDFEMDIAVRPYEVLGVATEREWTVEFPMADLHVMPAAAR